MWNMRDKFHMFHMSHMSHMWHIRDMWNMWDMWDMWNMWDMWDMRDMWNMWAQQLYPDRPPPAMKDRAVGVYRPLNGHKHKRIRTPIGILISDNNISWFGNSRLL